MKTVRELSRETGILESELSAMLSNIYAHFTTFSDSGDGHIQLRSKGNKIVLTMTGVRPTKRRVSYPESVATCGGDTYEAKLIHCVCSELSDFGAPPIDVLEYTYINGDDPVWYKRGSWVSTSQGVALFVYYDSEVKALGICEV